MPETPGSDGDTRQSDSGQELVEEIGDDGQVLRLVSRAEMRAENLRHRMVAVVLRRHDGNLVVHQRAAWKDLHPSKWDIAFGGVPAVGESDRDAALRELYEEAGLSVASEQLVDLGTLNSDDEHSRWVGQIYLLTSDKALAPVDGEVAKLAEVRIDDLEAWAAMTSLCDDTERVVLPMVKTALIR